MAELVEKNSRYKHFKRQARFLRDGRCFTIAWTYPEKPWMADLRGVGPKNIPPDALCFIMETRKRACLVPLLVDRLRASRSNWFTWPDETSKRAGTKAEIANVIVHRGDASTWRMINRWDYFSHFEFFHHCDQTTKRYCCESRRKIRVYMYNVSMKQRKLLLRRSRDRYWFEHRPLVNNIEYTYVYK